MHEVEFSDGCFTELRFRRCRAAVEHVAQDLQSYGHTRPMMRQHQGRCIPFTYTVWRVLQHRPGLSTAESDHTKLHAEGHQPFHLPPGCGHLPTSHRLSVIRVSLLRVLHNKWDRAATKDTLLCLHNIRFFLGNKELSHTYPHYFPSIHGGGKV
jgi:hypothetical protein